MISLLQTFASNFEEFEFVLSIFGVLVSVVIVVVTLIRKVKDKFTSSSNETPFDQVNPNQNGFLTDEQIRYQNQLKARKTTIQGTQTSATVDFHAGDHSHVGVTETYNPIVGSLGVHNDEGCDELNGVRLIATDLMYQDDNDNVTYDYDAIRKSIILGEVLNNARFNHPYGKK